MHGMLATIGITLVALGFGLNPNVAAAEHCAGALYVDDLQPSVPQSWALGSTHVISWLIGDGCGPLTYRVEFPWVVEGFVGDQVVFRVRRVLDDREPPHAYTSPIEIESAVPTRQSSWSALRARY